VLPALGARFNPFRVGAAGRDKLGVVAHVLTRRHLRAALVRGTVFVDLAGRQAVGRIVQKT
jgi:hypothetical protein